MRGEEGEGKRRQKRVRVLREDGACSISNDLHTSM